MNLRLRLTASSLVCMTACMPPSVQAVEDWLVAYEKGDAATVAKNTCAADRVLAEEGARQVLTTGTSTLVLMMPPRPIRHEIHEIETKEPGRHTVLTTLTLKNPMASMSRKVGHVLPDMPETRPLKHRFLVVKEGETWGLKFDLELRQRRLQFAADFERLLSAKRFEEATAVLEKTPPRPDAANSLRKSDRLRQRLEQRLKEEQKKLKTKTATRAPKNSDATQ